MEQVLFIDANIYLRFYDSNSEEFKKLLTSIEEVKDNIFVTKQVQHEVERNKLQVFLASFASYDKQFEFTKTTLPEHLEATTEKEIKEWNVITDELNKKIKEQKKRLKGITQKLLSNITEGTDEVSQILKKIFTAAKDANSSQKERARTRKEIGNPPGKVLDPLGDQITWEQLLDTLSSAQELWIISNDRDYLFEFDKKCYLNSFLNNELIQKNKTIKVNCFNTLSEGFASFNKSKRISALPEEKELGKITSEEKESNRVQLYLYGYGPHGAANAFGNSRSAGWPVATGYTGVAFPSLTGTYSFFSRRCAECGKEEYGPLQAYTSFEFWNKKFRSCPSCNRYLCDECWPYQATPVVSMTFGAQKCPKCAKDEMSKLGP